MDNNDVASVNARGEYMGNVTVSLNQKSLSRACTVFIENAWVVLPRVCSVHKSRRAAVLKAGEKP